VPNPDQHTDHRAEALKALNRRLPGRVGKPESSAAPDYGAAQVHASLAIAQGQERVAEEIKAFRELPRGVENGDLTRWILDALELGADDPSDAEAARMQRVIQAAVEGWFAPAGGTE
jgi:hypothetical protein